MSGFIRSSRICPVGQIHSSLLPPLREYFQVHQLGDVDTETRLCCETITDMSNPGRLAALFNSLLKENIDTSMHLAILLTADWFIWARSGDRSSTIVSGARFKTLQVKAFTTRRTKHMALDVSGFMSDSKNYARGTLELGSEPAAQEFCEEAVQAVLKANPPVKSKWPKWMGF